MNLNKVILIGRISQQPSIFQSRSGMNIVRFTIAVSRDNSSQQEEITDFLPIVAFSNNATFISKYFNKGDLISIVGMIESNQFINKNGENVSSISIVVEKIKQLEPLSVTQSRAEKNGLLRNNQNNQSNHQKNYENNIASNSDTMIQSNNDVQNNNQQLTFTLNLKI